MIIDRLEYADRYVALHPLFGAAFRFLREMDPYEMEDGKHLIQGEELFAIVERTNGKGRTGSKVEHHRRYIDIQYVVSGNEQMGWMPIGNCHEASDAFDSQRDIGFYTDKPETWLDVVPGCFTIFFPEDGHAPLSGTGPVHKVVLKIAMTLEQVLEDLKAELEVSHRLQPENRDRLLASIAEIEQAIRQQESLAETLSQRLREMAQDFELTHPRLTHTVGRVADALAQIGI
jgi:biofilm protein TabA